MTERVYQPARMGNATVVHLGGLAGRVVRVGRWGWLAFLLALSAAIGTYIMAAFAYYELGRPVRFSAYYSLRDMSGHGGLAALLIMAYEAAILGAAAGMAAWAAYLARDRRPPLPVERIEARMDRARDLFADGRIDEATLRLYLEPATSVVDGSHAALAQRPAATFLRWFALLTLPLAFFAHTIWFADNEWIWVPGDYTIVFFAGVLATAAANIYAAVRWGQVRSRLRRSLQELRTELAAAEDAIMQAARKNAPAR